MFHNIQYHTSGITESQEIFQHSIYHRLGNILIVVLINISFMQYFIYHIMHLQYLRDSAVQTTTHTLLHNRTPAKYMSGQCHIAAITTVMC